MEILRVLAEGTGTSPIRSAVRPDLRSFRYQLVWKGSASHISFICLTRASMSISSACLPLPPWRERVKGLGKKGAPTRFRFLEAGTAIDERRVASVPAARLIGSRLVHVEGDGIEHDAIVFEGAAHSDEAARHVGAHSLGVALEGIAPAAAPAGLEAEEVAALEHDAVAKR